MVELFKVSSQEYRSAFERQIQVLEDLNKESMERRDERWRAARDVASTIARDILRQVLPSDSNLLAMYSLKATTPADGAIVSESTRDVNAYELALYRAALQNVNWDATNRSALSTVSPYSEVQHALPEMIYRHPAFRWLLAFFVAMLGAIAFGVFKFYNVTVDIEKSIKAKQDALDAEFTKQKTNIESSLAKQQTAANALSAELNGINVKFGNVKTQISDLERDAQATLARFTMQAHRNVEDEVANSVKRVHEAIAQKQSDAAKLIGSKADAAAESIVSAAAKRVGEIMINDGKAFKQSLAEFTERITASNKIMGELEGRQKSLEGKQLLLTRALNAYSKPESTIVDRLAIYVDQALWVVYVCALVLPLLVIANIVLLWRMPKKKHGLL